MKKRIASVIVCTALCAGVIVIGRNADKAVLCVEAAAEEEDDSPLLYGGCFFYEIRSEEGRE